MNFAPPATVLSYGFYSYDTEATDPENNVLTFSLFSAPNGMSIIPQTGIIYWYPQGSDEGGPYTVTIQVSDGTNTVSESFEITVIPGTPPVLPTGSTEGEVPSSEPEEAENVFVPEDNLGEESLGSTEETEEKNTEGANLLANIGAWFRDNLFIPILVVVIALIFYLIYLAFLRKKKNDKVSPLPTTDNTGSAS